MSKQRKDRQKRPKPHAPPSPSEQTSLVAPPQPGQKPTQPAQNREPKWGLRATLAVIGIMVSLCSAGVGAYVATNIQAKREQQQLSQIGYAIFTQPAPVPGEDFDTTRRWKVTIEVFNSGPVDARTVVLNLHTPPPAVFLHSPPEVMSDAAAAKVEVRKRDPDGIYQVVITNLIKGDELFLQMFYVVPDDRKQEFMERWTHGGMFEADFGRRFISHFFFTGEHLAITNFGAMPLNADFADQD